MSGVVTARTGDDVVREASQLLRRGASVEVFEVDPKTRAQTCIARLTPESLPDIDDTDDLPYWTDRNAVMALLWAEPEQPVQQPEASTEVAVIETGEVETGHIVDVDHELSEAARERIIAGVAANTRRAYSLQLERYAAWCAEHGRTALPATPETLAEFVSHLCDLDLGPASIQQAIAAVRTAHRLAGHRGKPDTKLALDALRGHRKQRAEQGARTRKAPPITQEMLRAMIDASPADALVGLRDRVLLVIGWAMMGRRSELAALRVGDIAETPDGIEILIRVSKTDQDAHGAVVPIPRGSHGATEPVRVIRAWLEALAERGADVGQESRLLRSVDRHGHPSEAIDSESINRVVRAAALRAKVPNAERITAHSLRAGGATSAYRAGAPVSVIAQHGRWSEKSPVVLGYIRAVDQWADNPMRGLL